MAKNPYETLGVPRDADTDTIRKTYRKLARQYHPDLNPGDEAAEARFKEISQAYGVLGDEEKRRLYDEFGDVSLESGFDPEKARRAKEDFASQFGQGRGPDMGEFQFGDLDDILSGLFGGRGGRARGGPGARGGRVRMRGADVEARLDLDFVDAVQGCERRLTLTVPTPEGGSKTDTVTVRIPPGVADGDRLRVPGKGSPGLGDGPPGDLWTTVRVAPHPVFRRDGSDLELDVPVSVREAVLGAQVEIPTLTGRATVTVPPGSDSGRRLRLRGKGVPARSGGEPGDLYVRLQIRVPREVDEETRKVLERLGDDEDALREDLFR